MKKVYILFHVSFEMDRFEDLFDVSESKEKLYNKAKEYNDTIPILENNEDYSFNKLINERHFLISEFECI